ncbi:MAG: hypothetical protein ABSF23_13625 [Terracidiphilus sp.]|jgi:hypothetical protein
MRVKVYELKPRGGWFHKPSGGEFVLDKSRLHCIITIEGGEGSFQFLDPSREKLIRELFDAPSTVFVAGGQSPDGAHWDAVEHHPAWSVEAIEAIVKDELYGHSLGATIEYEDRKSILTSASEAVKRIWRRRQEEGNSQ